MITNVRQDSMETIAIGSVTVMKEHVTMRLVTVIAMLDTPGETARLNAPKELTVSNVRASAPVQ